MWLENVPGFNRAEAIGDKEDGNIESADKNKSPPKKWSPFAKGQLISEWIYEVIVSPKIKKKNCQDFCPH